MKPGAGNALRRKLTNRLFYKALVKILFIRLIFVAGFNLKTFDARENDAEALPENLHK